MLIRGFALSAALLTFAPDAIPDAMAGESQPGVLRRASCTVVRYYVAKYSAAAAETWARSHGATDAEIEAARHCLGNAPVQAKTPQTPSQTAPPTTPTVTAGWAGG